MKKIFIIALVLLLNVITFAQGKFSANMSNVGNVLTFKIRPDVTTVTGFSTIEFFVRHPTSAAPFIYSPVTVNTANFPGMTGSGNAGSGQWEILRNETLYMIPGFNVDHFVFTAPAVATTPATYVGGVEYNVISVVMLGTPPNTVDLQFTSEDAEATSYLSITDQNGGDLRPAALTNFFYPTTLSTPGPNSSTIYYQQLTAVPLPVKFLNFTATKNNNSALLNWLVENEDANTASYEIEVSTTGAEFRKVATLQPLNNGRSSNSYSFTQDNLSGIRNNGILYFRIKQIDKDGKFVYSDIRNVRISGRGLVLGVYPNPVKQNAKVTFDLESNEKISLILTDASGKQVWGNQLQGVKGLNMTDINMSKFATGTYNLKLQTATESKVISVLKAD